MLSLLASQLDLPHEFLTLNKWLDRVDATASDMRGVGADGKIRGLSTKNDAGLVAHHRNVSPSQAPPHMLADFFRHDFQHMAGGDVIMDTAGARNISAVLRASDLIKAEVMKKYVEGWRRMGVLE